MCDDKDESTPQEEQPTQETIYTASGPITIPHYPDWWLNASDENDLM